MNRDQRNVIIRIAVIVGAVGLLCFLIFGRASPRQYECVMENELYRAAVTTPDDFVTAGLKVEPQSLIIIADEAERNAQTVARAREYAFKNRLKVNGVAIAPGGEPTPQDIARLAEFLSNPRNVPGLIVDPDGVRAGKVAAAYRLLARKMPLADVERLAAIPDAPPETTQAIRAFARRLAARNTPTTTQAAPATGLPAAPQ